MADPQEIPGFCWDPDRKRYFRVHNTGQLHDSSYSKSAVAERDRSTVRKTARERARLLQGSAPTCLRQNEFEFKQLQKRAANAFMGAPEEIVSGLCVLESGQLVTGSRNGAFAVGQQRSRCARSIVATHKWGGRQPVLAAVSEEGSIAAWDQGGVALPNRFISALCPVDGKLLIATDRGLVSVESEGAVLEELFGRITTATRAGESAGALLGGAEGQIWRLDMRSRRRELLARMPGVSAVTHVGTLRNPHQLLACGLRDEMYVFDARGRAEPLRRFADYRNWSSLTHGFAINGAGTACAVALDNSDVVVLDATTGKTVGRLAYGRPQVAQTVVPPSVAWTEWGVYIASMNCVRLHARRGGRVPAPEACDESLVESLAATLNAKIAGASPALVA